MLICIYFLLDVKTERWRLRAKSVIDSLPRRLYQDIIGVAPSNSSAAETAPITAAAVITVFNRCISPELLNNASNGTAAEETENQSSSNKKRCIRPEPCPCTSSSPTSSTNATGNTAADVNVDAGADAGNIVSKEVDRCVVCMDDFQCDEELIVFPCRHYFHIPCTEGWLAVSVSTAADVVASALLETSTHNNTPFTTLFCVSV